MKYKKLNQKQKQGIKSIINQWAPKNSYNPIHLNVAKTSSTAGIGIITTDLILTGGSLLALSAILSIPFTQIGLISIYKDRFTNSSGQKLELPFQARIAIERMELSLSKTFDSFSKLKSLQDKEKAKKSISNICNDLDLVLNTAFMNKKDTEYLINIDNKKLNTRQIKYLQILNSLQATKKLKILGV